jgi:putative ABC transport system permease protein
MKRLRVLLLRLFGIFASPRHDAEFDEELEALLQFHIAEHVRSGMTPAEARRQALIRIGGTQSVKQAYRDQRGLPAVETTLQDVRFGARMLRRHGGYTAVAFLTLALGVGTSTTMFSIVDAVMLRPFPFPDPDRLVMVWEINSARGIRTFTGSAANYVDWRQSVTTVADLGAWELRRDNRTDGAQPEQVQGAVASAQFFRALGIAPRLGRFFLDEEDRPSGRFVAVLGHEYWQREFRGDTGVLGRSLVINGEAHKVVGVMPAMRSPFRADLWRPLAADVASLDRGDHSLFVIGRLASGQTLRSAEAELQTVAARLAESFPESNRGWSVRTESVYDALVPDRTRRSMLTLLAAVGLLLLIACVNVASLTLARTTSRLRELSTRFALGAGRTRLIRQLFTESALLAGGSAALGILSASWLLDVVQWLDPGEVPGLAEARLNPYAVAFAVAVAGATTIVFGLLPAQQVSRQFSQAQWLSTRTSTAGPRMRMLRQVFVIAQIALALVLLVGSGLLLASVSRLLNVPLGFASDQVITARIALSEQRYGTMPQYVAFVDRLLGELRSRPGVAAAGISSSVPFDGAYTVMQVRRETDRDKPDAESVLSQWRVIAGEYFPAVGIPTLAGRIFTDADDDSVPRVTIISQSLAQRVFGDQDPLGRDILVGDARRPYRVIGIAGAARLTALDGHPEPTMYFHYRQFGWPPMAIAVRAAGKVDGLAGTIRSAVTAVDPEQPVVDERRLDAVIGRAVAAPQMNAAFLSAFAVLALILAAIGIYGMINYSAAQRTPEISLRLALGARPASVFFLVVRNGIGMTVTGVAIGVLVATLAANSLGTLLFEVSPLDPQVYATAVAFVLGVAIVACCIPARRAMHADPVTALRQE